MPRSTTYKFEIDEIDELNFYNDFYLFFVERKGNDSDLTLLIKVYKYGAVKNVIHTGRTRIPLPLKKFKNFIDALDDIVEKARFPYLAKSEELFKQEYEEFKTKILAKYKVVENQKKQAKKQKEEVAIKQPKKKSKEDTPKVSPIASTTSGNDTIHQSGKFIEKFVNTRWYCYEYQKGGISRKTLEFRTLNTKGYCEIVHTSSDSGLGSWVGDARYIDADHLLVGICRNSYNADKTERFYTHFTVMVDDRAEDISLCIGHKTFFHAGNKHVVSKTIVLVRVEKKETDFKPRLLDFSEIKPGEQILDEDIQLFLSSKHQNRLTTPHKPPTIYNLKTFNNWIKPHKYRSTTHEALTGTYHLYYQHSPEDDNFVIEYFTISKSLSGQFLGHYSKKNSGDKRKYWEGLISENAKTRTMSVTLEGPKKAGESLDHYDEPLFLMLSMPEDDDDRITTLTGIITGIRDGNRGPVARLVLVLKFTMDSKSGKEVPCKNFDLALIKKFFEDYKQSSRVRPPHETSVSQFEDLKKTFKKRPS